MQDVTPTFFTQHSEISSFPLHLGSFWWPPSSCNRPNYQGSQPGAHWFPRIPDDPRPLGLGGGVEGSSSLCQQRRPCWCHRPFSIHPVPDFLGEGWQLQWSWGEDWGWQRKQLWDKCQAWQQGQQQSLAVGMAAGWVTHLLAGTAMGHVWGLVAEMTAGQVSGLALGLAVG